MIHINDDTILVGTTDLRSEIPQLMKEVKFKKIIVMKRGKPIGVLENIEQHEEKERLLDTFEELVLGFIAKERYESSTAKNFVRAETVAKKIGLKKHAL